MSFLWDSRHKWINDVENSTNSAVFDHADPLGAVLSGSVLLEYLGEM